jgi:hypothetical protein
MQATSLVVGLLIGASLAGCQMPTSDRVIQVRVAVVSPDQTPIPGCRLSMKSGDSERIIDSANNIRPQFLNGFINPPTSGSYYFMISCPGHEQTYASEKFDFAHGPYLHDLGTVVLK